MELPQKPLVKVGARQQTPSFEESRRYIQDKELTKTEEKQQGENDSRYSSMWLRGEPEKTTFIKTG